MLAKNVANISHRLDNEEKQAPRQAANCLASNRAHGSIGLFEIGFADVVAGFFFEDNGLEPFDDVGVGGVASEEGFEVVIVQAKKAGADFAVGGEGEAVAWTAEGFADGGDEANFTLPFFAVLEPPAGCGGGGMFHSGGFEIEGGLEAFEDFAAGDDVFALPSATRVEGHKFDEAHHQCLIERELGEDFEFVIVEIANDDGVNFYGREAQFPRVGNGGKQFTEAIAAGVFFEIIAVERIEAEGHAA